MRQEKPTYEELEAKLDVAESIIEALRKGEIDVVQSDKNTYLIRLKEMEDALRKANDELETRVQERTASLVLLNKQLRQLNSQLTLAEENERKRIARILHDDLQQLLIGAKMKLELVSPAAAPDQKQDIDKSIELIMESLEKSRSLTEELAPAALEHEDIAVIAEWLCRFMKRFYNMNLALLLNGPVHIRDRAIRILLFRSMLELLFNIVKHAGVDSARLRLSKDTNGNVQIIISDDGIGFDCDLFEQNENLRHQLGLFSIRESLSLFGGSMNIESGPTIGTTCSLIIPLQETS